MATSVKLAGTMTVEDGFEAEMFWVMLKLAAKKMPANMETSTAATTGRRQALVLSGLFEFITISP